jgi:hypothetical protein
VIATVIPIFAAGIEVLIEWVFAAKSKKRLLKNKINTFFSFEVYKMYKDNIKILKEFVNL